MLSFGAPFLVVAVLFLVVISQSVRVLRQYERGVVFRLGRLQPKDYGPGLFFLIPVIDKMERVSLRTIVHDVPPQDVITKDNVSVKVNAVVYFRVFEPQKAIVEVENYNYATSQLAQTTLRSVLGGVELDQLLSEREELGHEMQELLDRQTDPWGIKIAAVELKHVDLPEEMRRAMARQAEAEREKRAKIIHAQGELKASAGLFEAAETLSKNPLTVQLRYLQTLSDVAAEQNSTIVFPVPVEFLSSILRKDEAK